MYREKHMLMDNIKMGFNFFLSFSLVLTPCYGYTSEPSQTGVESITNRFNSNYAREGEKIPPAIKEAVNILEEMGTALDAGRWGEYVSEHHPQLQQRFRLLSLGHQEVDILDPTGKTSPHTIDFDAGLSSHYTYSINIRNIEVDFNEIGNLIFKGVIVEGDKSIEEQEVSEKQRKKQIGLIHRFKDIHKKDIIDWVYDREMLAVLHRERGLILYHMMFTKTILGSSAVPSVSVPSSMSLVDLKQVQLEFIDRAIAPPVDLGEDSKLKAGDLMVSYENKKGEKVTAQIFSRAMDLNHALFNMYLNLELLLQMRQLSMKNLQDVRDFETDLFQIERDIERVAQIMITPLINGNALSSLDKFKDLVKPIKYFVVYQSIDKDRDIFSISQWIEDYKKLKEKFPQLFNQRSNVTGENVSSADIANYLRDVVEIVETDDSKLRQLIEGFKNGWEGTEFQKKHPDATAFIHENLVNMGVASGALVYVFVNVSEIPKVDASNYTEDTVYQWVLVGLGALLFAFALAQYSVRILRFIEKFVPEDRSLKIAINQTIERWQNKRMRDRLAGFGFRIAGFVLPVFQRIFQFSGQPHLFSALTQGLNPFKRVRPDSHLGRVAGVNHSGTVLGFDRFRYNTHNENYDIKTRLIDIAVEQKQRINSLSRIMTYYAMSGKLFNMSSLLVGPLSLQGEELENIHKDRTLMRNFIWVSQKLSSYIHRSESIDFTRPVLEWDVEVINGYYEKALNLSEEVQRVSWTRKQTHDITQAVSGFLRNALNWNVEHAERLRHYVPETSIADQFYLGLVMDHITLVTFPLTPLTPRGEFFIDNMHRIAQEPNTLFNTSGPHLHEAFYNVYWHDVASARAQLVNLLPPTIKEKLLHISEEFKSLYEPVETYMSQTENKAKFWSYFLGWFPFLFTSSSWGDRIYEGTDREDRVDIGHMLWKTLKLSYRFIAPAISVGVLSRLFIADSLFVESFLGMMYFFLGGFVIFGWPQIATFSYNQVFNRKAQERKEIIDRVKFISYQINHDLYDSMENLNDAYIRAILDFKKLYHSSKSASENIVLDEISSDIKEFILHEGTSLQKLKEVINAQPLEEKQSQIRSLSLLLNTRDLPTTGNPWGLSIWLLITMGVYSNIAFVFLSAMSFEPTLEWAVKFGLGTLAGLFGLNLLASKKPAEHKEFLRNKAESVRNKIKNKCSALFKKKE